MEISFVSLGLFNHSETVTKEEAVIGRISNQDLKEIIPSDQLIIINRIGQNTELAHFFEFLFIKTTSLKIPTKFGIIPAVAPRKK